MVGEEIVTSALLAKTDTVVAGIPFFDEVFRQLGCVVVWSVSEGEHVTAPRKIAEVTGQCRCVLLGERTALNILSRASGIAAAAHRVATIAKSTGWRGEVAGTRKVRRCARRRGCPRRVLLPRLYFSPRR